MVPDAAQRVCGDCGEWAVVEDQGRAGGGGLWGFGGPADARGEVGGEGEGFGTNFDYGVGVREERGVAGGGLGQVEAVWGGCFGKGELEVGW